MQAELELAELQSDYADLAEELDRANDRYNELLEQHKWVHVILSILLEEQGGVVRISDELIAGYDLRGKITASREDGTSTWVIEVHPMESE